jgi:NAD(P)-dependent dehydrogenase (short-subunit alcohol dehydrogenase family)
MPVVVIGGHLGTGPAVVRAFVEQGAKVAVGVLAGHEPSQPAAIAGARNIAADLRDGAGVAAFFDACEQQLDGLSVVVIVAPPVKTGDAFSFTEAQYRAVIDAELLGPILCLKEAGRRMAERGGGRLISFSSMSGKTGVHPHVAPYAAAKGGLIAFSRSLAAELAPKGVTVNVIATALFDVQVAAMADTSQVVKGIPVGRVGRSEEAAHAVLYLASRNAGYVTGETMNLSGGRFMD